MHASIQVINGIPRLLVDGKVTAPNILMPVRGPQPEICDNEIARAGRYGMHLLCISPWASVRETVDTVLASDPNSIIMLRIAFPVDMNSLGKTEDSYIDQWGKDRHYYSIASDAWADYTKARIAEVLDQVAAYDRADEHVIGYHIGAADSGEWSGPFFWEALVDCSPVNQKRFSRYLTEKYGSDEGLQRAWEDGTVSLTGECVPKDMPNTEVIEFIHAYGCKERTLLTEPADQRYVDYWDYYNDLMAQRLIEMCAYIKERTGGKALTAAFFGYHTEARMPNSGQFSMSKVLADENVDIICAPISYLDRNEGGKGASMGADRAIMSFGKLWLDEADYRSPVRKAEGNSDVAGGLDTGGYCKSVEGLMEVVRRQMGKCMVDAGAAWWFDMVGRGWYDFDEFWSDNRFLSDLYEHYAQMQQNRCPDIALISDEYARHMEGDPFAIGDQLGLYMRDAFYKAGMSWGYYLTENLLKGHVPDAKLYVFLHPWRLDEEKTAAIKKALKGKKAVFMYGYGRTAPEDFAALCGARVARDGERHYDTAVYPTQEMKEAVPGFGSEAVAGFRSAQRYVCMDEHIRVLGRYKDGKAAMTMSADGNRIFCGGALLSPAQMRSLGLWAGGHLFLDTDDVLYADSALAVLHTCSAGEKRMRFPGICDVYDALEDRWYEQTDEVTFSMQEGITKLLFYGNKEEFHFHGIG